MFVVVFCSSTREKERVETLFVVGNLLLSCCMSHDSESAWRSGFEAEQQNACSGISVLLVPELHPSLSSDEAKRIVAPHNLL